jgi:hypothetical protein
MFMKRLIQYGIFLWLLNFSFPIFAQPCNMTGTYTIGPGGGYPTITAALSALRTTGLGGPVILELKTGYTSTAEAFPISFAGIPCISAINTLTLRPETGATNLQLNANTNTNALTMSNCRYITIDGRPGGTGTTRALTITNSAAGGNITNFSSDASYNTFTYLNLNGATTSTTSGVIAFLTTSLSITSGNSFNTISYCNIGNAATNPINSIYASGTAGKKNTGNKIQNCNIFNFYASSALSAVYGINIGANNTGWEISGNSFYQTFARGNNSANITSIAINDITSGGFQVLNNFIGGTAPGNGSTTMSYNGKFTGIVITTGAQNSLVQGNTISNITWRYYLSGDIFNGILLTRGKIDCNGNTIGSQTQQASIVSFSPYLTAPEINGISVTLNTSQTSTDSFFVRNNLIGGIRTQQEGGNYRETILKCIAVNGLSSAYIQVSGNTIGSTSVSNSIETTSDVDKQFGIQVNVTNATFGSNGYNVPYFISSNLVANVSGYVVAVAVSGGLPQVKDNTIRRITGAVTTAIKLEYAGNGSLIAGNHIHSLLSVVSGNGLLTGISADYCSGVTFSGNNIHSFQNPGGTISLAGISIGNNNSLTLHGRFNIQNNMIRLGVDTSGNIMPSPFSITGISTPLDSTVIAHNSIYIGGNGLYDAESNALFFTQGAIKSSRVVNNILQNSRYTGINSFYKGCVLKIDPTITDLNGLVLNNNIYYSANTETPTVRYKNGSYKGIVDWRAISNRDSNSVFYNPNFINPLGNNSTVNLHLANPNPAEGQGVAEATVTNDFDGELRSNFSPVDIGADAGNFSLQDGDAPVLRHAVFASQQVGTLVTYKVTITDNGAGVDTNGNNKPRMWFRKSFPVASSWLSVPGNLTQGSIKGGEWSFAPDFAAAGLSLSPGDSVAYYFTAQDLGQIINLGYSNSNGTQHTSVNAQVSPPDEPLRLLIYGLFADTVYVGNGEQYTSLTGNGGFFEAAKSNVFNPLSSDVQVIITSDLTETAIHGYSMFRGAGPRIRIGTNTPVVKLVEISNTADQNNPMLQLNDIYNLTIDGSVNGSGRYLHFTKTSYQPAYCQSVLYTGKKVQNFNLLNCIFSSNTNGDFYFMVVIGGTDMKQIRVKGNLFTDPSTGVLGLPKQMLAIAPNNNDTIIVKDNDFVNAGKSGLLILNSNANIIQKGLVLADSNHFYYKSSSIPSAGNKQLISVINNKVPVLLSNNFIGGSDRFCGGSPWIQDDGATFRGIYYYGSYDTAGSIQNNTFNNIWLTGGGTLTGIYITDGIFNVGTVQGNTIGSTSSDSGLVCGYIIKGIEGYVGVYQIPTPMVRIENNVIAGTISGNLRGLDFQGKIGIIRNNRIYNHLINNSGLPGYTGMRIWLDSGLVESNTLYNINSVVPYLNECFGIDVVFTGQASKRLNINRNRIYDLRADYGSNITGIRANQGQYSIENNQVYLSNGSITNNIPLVGINLANSGANTFLSTINYNSCVISGTITGDKASYALLVDGSVAPITGFNNNLLMNQRTGGTGGNFALGMLTSTAAAWPAGNANNNLYAAADTAAVNQWMTTGTVGMAQWRSLSQGDNNSTAESIAQLPPDSLFIAAANGNLDINTNTALCWKLNEKGKPIATISNDYGAIGVRSINTTNGKTDIGSDEFITTVPQPPVVNTLCPGGSIAITSDISGSNYQWQINTGSGFTNLANGGVYSNSTTATLSISSVPSAWYGYQYRCVVNGSSNSQVYALRFANVWTGSISNAWENAANWSCGQVPDGNTDVTINTGSNVVMSVDGTCRSIIIKPGGSLTLAPGVILTITH